MPDVKCCFSVIPQFTPLLGVFRTTVGRGEKKKENAALRGSSTSFQSCRTELIKGIITLAQVT